jgi:molybdate transport system substrate-binding protein
MKTILMSTVAALVIVCGPAAQAAEVTLIGPGGIRAAGEKVAEAFEKKTGNTVKTTFGSGGGTKERVIKGDAFDVPIVQPPVAPVIASGHVVPTSQKLFTSVSVGLAVKSGAPRPDISTADAVKRLFLAAKFIAYPNAATGAGAGISMNETLEKLGITEQMKPKIKIAQGGRGAMEMLAKGEVDYGLTYISEIITEPGVEFVAALPKDISPPTELIGFMTAHPKDPAATKALYDFFTGPEALAIYKATGMNLPGS